MAKGNGTSRGSAPGRYSTYETKEGADAALSFEVDGGVDYRDLYEYIGRGMSVNAALRGDDDRDKEELLEIADGVDRILSESTLGKDTVLFRGDNQEAFRRMFGVPITEENLSSLVGREGSKRDFTSTYASRGATGAEVQFLISMPGSKKGGLYLQPIKRARGDRDGENEVLLNRGIKFRITKAELGEGKTRTGKTRYIVKLQVI